MPKDKNRRRLLRKLEKDELIERIVFLKVQKGCGKQLG